MILFLGGKRAGLDICFSLRDGFALDVLDCLLLVDFLGATSAFLVTTLALGVALALGADLAFALRMGLLLTFLASTFLGARLEDVCFLDGADFLEAAALFRPAGLRPFGVALGDCFFVLAMFLSCRADTCEISLGLTLKTFCHTIHTHVFLHLSTYKGAIDFG